MEATRNPDRRRPHIAAQPNDDVAWRGLLRALRLRCPRCDIGRVTRAWFVPREACDEGGLRFERDEQDDYWLGAFRLNFIVTEVVFAVLLAVILVATWPDPLWAVSCEDFVLPETVIDPA